MIRSGVIKYFDTTFTPCGCVGDKFPKYPSIPVVRVLWKQVPVKDLPNRMQFTCDLCNHSWKLNDVKSDHRGIRMDIRNESEQARRRAL